MLPAQEQRQAEAAASRAEEQEGDRGGRGAARQAQSQPVLATSLASQEAVSWQSSVRATCEMPIYSLANIASDRITTGWTPHWMLQGCWRLGLLSGSDSESGCDLSASATYADMTARTQKRMGRL